MKTEPKIGMLLSFGKHAKGGDDEAEESDELTAAGELADAVKSGDKQAIVDAFKALMEACDSYEDEPEVDTGEE
jgi:undecaprenyl pyrophosphate synthase